MAPGSNPIDLFGSTPRNGPPGLEYVTDFISPEEEEILLVEIRNLPLAEARYKSFTARRRIVSFGSGYDFDPISRSWRESRWPGRPACASGRFRRRRTPGLVTHGSAALWLSVLGLIAPVYATSGHAATWIVRQDESGDLPTIQAAIDAAALHDTVLVDSGTSRCLPIPLPLLILLHLSGHSELRDARREW